MPNASITPVGRDVIDAHGRRTGMIGSRQHRGRATTTVDAPLG
jgi:hypothetical protein